MEFQGLTPKQAATMRLAPQARIAVWEGAVRSSKTIVSLLAWAQYVTEAPPGPLLMAGRTLDTLIRNVLDPLTDLLGPGQVKVVRGDGRAEILGRKIHLVGADNGAAESRIRGLTLAGAYVDELTILGGPRGEEWFNMLLTRLSVKGARLYATTNPGSPQHWLLTDYLSKAGLVITQDGHVERPTHDSDGEPTIGNLHRYRFTLDDNPALPDDYIADLKRSLSGLFYKRFIEGQWVMAEGAIYPMLDTEATQGTPPDQVASPVLAIDHGVSNPTHAVIIAVDATPDALNQPPVAWVLGECRLTDPNLTPEQQAQKIWAWAASEGFPANGKIVIDPAAAGFKNAMKQTTGRWPWDADNSVTEGISETSTLLGQGRLNFAAGKTPHLLRELTGYVWDQKAAERGEDKPVKVDDHGPDALRYGLMAMRLTRKRGV